MSETKVIPEAVEYWIYIGEVDDIVFTKPSHMKNAEKYKHVIDYSAYSALKAKCERLKIENEVLQKSADNELICNDENNLEYIKEITELTEQVAKLSAENERLKADVVKYMKEATLAILETLDIARLKKENADFRAALEEIEMAERISHKDTGLAVCSRIARAVLSKHEKKE